MVREYKQMVGSDHFLCLEIPEFATRESPDSSLTEQTVEPFLVELGEPSAGCLNFRFKSFESKL